MSCTQSSKQGWFPSCVWVEMSKLWPSAMLLHSCISIPILEISFTDMPGRGNFLFSTSFLLHILLSRPSEGCLSAAPEKLFFPNSTQIQDHRENKRKLENTACLGLVSSWLPVSLLLFHTLSPVSRSLVDSSPGKPQWQLTGWSHLPAYTHGLPSILSKGPITPKVSHHLLPNSSPSWHPLPACISSLTLSPLWRPPQSCPGWLFPPNPNPLKIRAGILGNKDYRALMRKNSRPLVPPMLLSLQLAPSSSPSQATPPPLSPMAIALSQTCSFSERCFVCEPYCIWEAGRAAWPVTVAHWLDKPRVLTTLLVSYASGAQRPPRTERIREGWGQVIVIRRATWKFTSCFVLVESKVKDKVLYNWTQILHKAVDSLSLCQAVMCGHKNANPCMHAHACTHVHTHTHTT